MKRPFLCLMAIVREFTSATSPSAPPSSPSSVPGGFPAGSPSSSPSAQPSSPLPPVPAKNQLRWQEMEMYAFIHYSLNTYTDQEWGFGNQDPQPFNPSSLDCRQSARVCKQAGMKGNNFTAKHHCGLCMWPSAYTEYPVKNSP